MDHMNLEAQSPYIYKKNCLGEKIMYKLKMEIINNFQSLFGKQKYQSLYKLVDQSCNGIM